MPDVLVAPIGGFVDAPARPDAGRTWRHRAALPLAAACTAAAGTVARFGYGFGMDDQAVIALKGIARADPTAFVGDWFTARVPQPHWLFDLVTFAGERLGVLPVVYLLWWAASMLAFGLASAWLARRFIPERSWLAVLVGPVLAFGPATALGSGTALWGFALPQGLGACLGFLAVAALVTGRWRPAVAASVLAALAHVQHGADLGPVLLVTASLATLRPLRHRLALAGAGAGLIAQAAVVGHLRGIQNGGDGWLDACRLAIPFHCNANSWTAGVFVGGAVVVGLALTFAAAQRHLRQTVLPAVALPAAGLLAAAVADRFDVPVFGQLAQRFNVYRLAGIVLPVAAFALVWLAARLGRGPVEIRRATVVLVLGVVWLAGPDAGFHQGGSFAGPSRIHVGYDRSDPGVAAALAIGRATDPGAVIAADPAVYWLRAVSRRAVVADCKGIAFGGPAWAENSARIEALGGWACTPGPRRFAGVTAGAVEALQGSYGVTHVLLSGDDPKLDYAETHWNLILRTEPRTYPLMEFGWSLFRLPDPPAP